MRHNEGMATEFADWITARTNLSARQIAELIGMSSNAITRANAEGTVAARTVVAACIATDTPVLEGLAVAGYLTSEEVAVTKQRIVLKEGERSLDSLPDSTLLSHLHLRALDREQTNITAIAPEGIEDDLEQPVGGREVIDLTQRARPSQTLTHNPYAGEPMAAQPDTPDATTDSLGGDES